MQPTRESNTRSIGKPFDRGTAWMRLLAAYFVVLIHAAWRFSAAEVIWLSAARFSVPLFVIISGFYLLASPQPGRKLIEKTLRLLWLMLFWSAVYYLYVRLTGTMSGGAAALAVYLLTQPVHLWYLYAAAALYLFTPVFFVFAEHAGRSVYRYALFVSTAGRHHGQDQNCRVARLPWPVSAGRVFPAVSDCPQRTHSALRGRSVQRRGDRRMDVALLRPQAAD